MNNHKPESKTSIEYLSNEFAHQKYLLRHDENKKLFYHMDMPDYLIMSMLKGKETEQDSSRIYLKEIAQHMDLPMNRVSNLVKKLEENGMVLWTHDEQGTYITPSEYGKTKVKEQSELLKNFYGKAIESFGKGKFIEMLDLLTQFGDITHSLLHVDSEEKEAEA